ncbi:MAG: TonB-dependent receptor [Burkholderiales bacterium]|nr:TonB-dependent receptor [Burkholderiales bacterium]
MAVVIALAGSTPTARADDTAPPARPARDALGEPAPAKIPLDASGLPLTKVVVERKQIEEGAEQEGYGEAVRNVPGAMSNNGKGNANDSLRFRGLQLNLYSNYRINGGLAITNVITVPTEDKEKVEALKGANALMFGLASPAGILNMVTKRAGRRDVSSVSISGNGFGQLGVAFDLGRRFGERKQYGFRVNLVNTHIETGTRGIGGDGSLFSLAADANPTRELGLKIDYENYNKNVVEQGGIVAPTAVNGVIAIPTPPDPRKLLSGTWDVYTPRTENMVAHADYKLGSNWTATAEYGRSLSSRNRTQVRITLNNVLTGDGQQNITFIKNQQYTNTYVKGELQGHFETGSLHHDLTLGYSSAERDSNIPSTYSPKVGNNRPINVYSPVALSAPPDPGTPLTYKPNVSKDAGLYVYDTLAIGHDVKLLAGLRKVHYSFSQTLVGNGPLLTTHYTPTAKGYGALWDFAPRTTAYTSWMQAMEDGPIAPSGPIQGSTVVNAFAVLQPANSTQKEIGLRTGYIADTFINLDYFDILKSNTNNLQLTPTTVVFAYDGNLHLSGWELQANTVLARHWTLSGSAQIMKAIQQGGVSSGMRTENTPDDIVTANVGYALPWVRGLSVRAGTSYISKRYVGNAQQGAIPAVNLYSAGAAYNVRAWGTRVALQFSVDNLTNKRYWSSATSSAFGAGMDRALRFSAKLDL